MGWWWRGGGKIVKDGFVCLTQHSLLRLLYYGDMPIAHLYYYVDGIHAYTLSELTDKIFLQHIFQIFKPKEILFQYTYIYCRLQTQ